LKISLSMGQGYPLSLRPGKGLIGNNNSTIKKMIRFDHFPRLPEKEQRLGFFSGGGFTGPGQPGG
jgi:hypothetical protein